MFLKKIDLYIIKKFLGTYVFALIVIISLSVVFDYSEKIDDFYEKGAPTKAIIFDYYLNFIPYYANLFSSFFTFIAVLLFTSRLASRYEIFAMFTSGISFHRLLRPYLISAFIVGGFSFMLISYVLPPANKARIEFQDQYLKNRKSKPERNLHKQVEPGLYAYVERFDQKTLMGYKFTLERFVDGDLQSKLVSQYAKFDTATGRWDIKKYVLREFYNGRESVKEGNKMDTLLNLTLEDFVQKRNAVEAMTSTELDEHIAKQEFQGVGGVEISYIEKYRRMAFPFSAFILTVIGFAVAGRKTKGGTGMHIGLGLLFAAAYVLFMQVSAQFAISGYMSPLMAVWVPNIIFFFVSILFYRSAPK